MKRNENEPAARLNRQNARMSFDNALTWLLSPLHSLVFHSHFFFFFFFFVSNRKEQFAWSTCVCVCVCSFVEPTRGVRIVLRQPGCFIVPPRKRRFILQSFYKETLCRATRRADARDVSILLPRQVMVFLSGMTLSTQRNPTRRHVRPLFNPVFNPLRRDGSRS